MKEKSKKYYEKGCKLYKEGDLNKALEMFNKSINIEPNINSYDEKGNILIDFLKYDEAIVEFKNIIKIDKNNSEAYNNIGYCLGFKGKYKKAIKWFDKAIKINPNNENYYLNKGNYLCSLGEYNKALNLYNKVIELNPNNILGYKNKTFVLENLGKNIEENDNNYNEPLIKDILNKSEQREIKLKNENLFDLYLNKEKRDLFFKSDFSLKESSNKNSVLLDNKEINFLFKDLKENYFGINSSDLVFINTYYILFIFSLLISLFIQLSFTGYYLLLKGIIFIIFVLFFKKLKNSLYEFLYTGIVYLNIDNNIKNNIEIVNKGTYGNFFGGYIMFLLLLIIVNILFKYIPITKDNLVIIGVVYSFIITYISNTIYKDTINFKIAHINTFYKLDKYIGYKATYNIILNAVIYIIPPLTFFIINKYL